MLICNHLSDSMFDCISLRVDKPQSLSLDDGDNENHAKQDDARYDSTQQVTFAMRNDAAVSCDNSSNDLSNTYVSPALD